MSNNIFRLYYLTSFRDHQAQQADPYDEAQNPKPPGQTRWILPRDMDIHAEEHSNDLHCEQDSTDRRQPTDRARGPITHACKVERKLGGVL